MKQKLITIACTITLSCPIAFGQFATIDIANLEKSILQLRELQEEVEQTRKLRHQIGNPADIRQVAGYAQTLANFSQGAADVLEDIGIPISEAGEMSFDGGGVFRPISPDYVLADGSLMGLTSVDYRKFEALYKAIEHFNTVTADTQSRRDSLRDAMRQSTAQLDQAQSDAEVQKLKAIVSAQTSELATLNAQRSEAADRVMIVQAANQADENQQEKADMEMRMASVRSGLREAVHFFQADSRPTSVPKPGRYSR